MGKDQHMVPGRKPRRDARRAAITQSLLLLLAVMLINIPGSYFFTRIDLTAEKRYTLSDATREILEGLDDVVFLRIYLEGEFPAGFKRLNRSTREMLDEFRAWSDQIEYEFIDPSASDDAKVRNDIYRQLVEKGLQPTNLQVREGSASEQRIIFPGALLTYKGREVPLQLLQSQAGQAPEQILNNSIQDLEYNLANAIRRLTSGREQQVAVLSGHGEPDDLWLWDLMSLLDEYYTVERIPLEEKIFSLTERDYNADSSAIVARNKYEAVIVANPLLPFSERDKFILDQYIMHGGRVLWFLDRTNADMDSLRARPETVGISRELKLDDMLFRYGVRINADLLMDIRSMPIPVKTGEVAGQPQFEFYPWYYMPLAVPASRHPVVSNLNAVKTEFVSSIDTVTAAGVVKTPLLTTSRYTRKVQLPAYVSLEILKQEPDEALFGDGPQTVAYLLEGSFTSLFRNRVPPEISDSPEIGFREMSVPNRMIVVSDGDVPMNQVSANTRNPLPLGYDQYTGETFGNADFVLNAVNYLCDGSGLIEIRAREISLRMLDRARLNDRKLFWQLLNTVLPIALVVLLSLTGAVLRRRRFSR